MYCCTTFSTVSTIACMPRKPSALASHTTEFKCMSYWCLSIKQNELPRPSVPWWYCLPHACTVRTIDWHRYRYATCVWASISRLTVLPSCLFPRTVTRRVSGIKYIVNQSSPTSPTCKRSNSSTSVLLVENMPHRCQVTLPDHLPSDCSHQQQWNPWVKCISSIAWVPAAHNLHKLLWKQTARGNALCAQTP